MLKEHFARNEQLIFASLKLHESLSERAAALGPFQEAATDPLMLLPDFGEFTLDALEFTIGVGKLGLQLCLHLAQKCRFNTFEQFNLAQDAIANQLAALDAIKCHAIPTAIGSAT